MNFLGVLTIQEADINMFGIGLTSKLEDKIADLESTIFYLRNTNDYLRKENDSLRKELRRHTTERDQAKKSLPTAPPSRVVCGTMEPADTGIEDIMMATLTYHMLSDTDSGQTYDSGSSYDSCDSGSYSGD